MGSRHQTPNNTKLVESYCERFPKTASRTLAQIIYRDNPKNFTTLESARSLVRYVRGQSGVKDRLCRSSRKDLFKKSGKSFSNLPKPLTEFDKWEPVQVPTRKALLLSDIHIPYHDLSALVPALKHGQDLNPDTVILNGDTADFFSVSFWEKDPRKRNLTREIESVREFLKELRSQFKKSRILFKLGNHEERWERYLSVKAPELLGVEDFEIEKIFQFENHGIEIVKDKRPMKLGKLFVAHGHEWRFGIAAPVNPARGFYLRAKTQVICGHLHQTSAHSERTMDGIVISTWSTGCLCDLHPSYAPMNNWNHGFAQVEVDKNDNFQVQNFKVIHKRVYPA